MQEVAHRTQLKLTFIARKTPFSREVLKSAEKFIAKELIPALVSNTAYNEKFRQIFSLPLREGGLSIMLPEDREQDYEKSKLISNILASNNVFDAEEEEEGEKHFILH